MKVTLTGATQSMVIGIDNLEDYICYIAKVSNPQFQDDFTNSKKLLSYLIKHNHWSPFESASITLELETSRDIARQVLRHRSFSFQEFSGRYSNIDAMKNPFLVREARYQDPKNRQNSTELDMTKDKDRDLDKTWRLKQQQLNYEAKMAYDWAIQNGIAKEVARSVLPEGNTVSRLYMQGNVRSWIHYIQLRSGNGTQKEHKLLAIECAEAIAPIFPMIRNFITTEASH